MEALDPKAKAMATYPERKHLPGHLLPAERPSIKDILNEITNLILQNIASGMSREEVLKVIQH